MKRIALLVFTLQLTALHLSYAETKAAPNILNWPRMKVDEFGCYLEKHFGFKDEKFNCSLRGYVNTGDPCHETEAYYEGPSFPPSKAKEINSVVEAVDLSWEHGELQSVSLQFVSKIPEEELKRIFALPPEFNYPPLYKNIMDISIQDCSKTGNCLIVQGFDHLGAGDAECGPR